MGFNESLHFFRSKENYDTARRKPNDEEANFWHRVRFYLSVMQGNPPPNAAISQTDRFAIRTKAKALTPLQQETMAMLNAALEYDDKGLIRLFNNKGVMAVIERVRMTDGSSNENHDVLVPEMPGEELFPMPRKH